MDSIKFPGRTDGTQWNDREIIKFQVMKTVIDGVIDQINNNVEELKKFMNEIRNVIGTKPDGASNIWNEINKFEDFTSNIVGSEFFEC